MFACYSTLAQQPGQKLKPSEPQSGSRMAELTSLSPNLAGECAPPRITRKEQVESKDPQIISTGGTDLSEEDGHVSFAPSVLNAKPKPQIERKRTIHPGIAKIQRLHERMVEQIDQQEQAVQEAFTGRHKYWFIDASHQQNTVHKEHAEWKHRLHEFLHSRPIQLILTCALILDIVVVIVDLFLEGICSVFDFFHFMDIAYTIAVICAPGSLRFDFHAKIIY